MRAPDSRPAFICWQRWRARKPEARDSSLLSQAPSEVAPLLLSASATIDPRASLRKPFANHERVLSLCAHKSRRRHSSSREWKSASFCNCVRRELAFLETVISGRPRCAAAARVPRRSRAPTARGREASQLALSLSLARWRQASSKKLGKGLSRRASRARSSAHDSHQMRTDAESERTRKNLLFPRKTPQPRMQRKRSKIR